MTQHPGGQRRRLSRAGRGFVLLAIGCLLALAGLACSDRGPNASVTSNSDEANAAPADMLLAAARQTTAADTVHVKLSASLDGSVLGAQQVTGTGGVDFGQQQGELQLQVLGTDIQVVTADNELYLQAALLGDGWYRVDGDGSSAGMLANGLLDPAQQFALLEDSATDVTKVGSEKINGQDTTHYRATIDVAAAAAKEGASQEQIQQLQDAGISTIPVEAWVGDDGRLVRMSLSYDGKGADGPLAGGKLSVTVDYSGYGDPVEVTVPPADEVKDLGESGLGGLLGGGALTQ
jgi:hypothetical protein